VLRIRLLGPFEVLVDGVPVQVRGARSRSLLAILSLTPGHSVAADTLVERCWGDTPGADSRASLHAAVRRLRVLLGQETIRTTEYGYALEITAEHVDAAVFADLLTPISTATAEDLDTALALWRGEPFGGEFCEWLRSHGKRPLVEQYLSAVERRADLVPAEHLTEMSELTRLYPLRESLWAHLLTALDSTGRTAEALEQYGVVRARIGAELGVEPGPELQQVFERLLAGEARSPKTEAASASPQQLPSDLPGFTGREALLRLLDKAFDGAGTPIVLHGQGGSGKTTLAVHWAHMAEEDFPDGRFFVNLHGYGPGEPVDPAVVLDDLLRELGIPIDRIPPATDARTALLRSTLAGRRVLVVLDDARNEAQIRPLLPGAGAVVLVTSRNRLRGLAALSQAEQIAVDQLSDEEARELLAARTGAMPGDENLLSELARLCNHLPLALAIAAEQVVRRPGRGLVEVVDELRNLTDRLDTLQSGDDPAADVRAAFSWSYRTLEPEVAKFFRHLGRYPAPVFSAAAAAALTGTKQRSAVKMLGRLADLHLVVESAPGRYRLHDLLRAYAAEQDQVETSADDRWAGDARLFTWFVQTVIEARVTRGELRSIDEVGTPLPGVEPETFADYESADTWCDLEADAVSALVRAAVDRGHHDPAARLALQFWTFLLKRGQQDEAIALQRIARDSARVADLPSVEALALHQLGTTLTFANQCDEAVDVLRQSIALYADLHSTEGQAHARGSLALARNLQGRHEESLTEFAAALDLSSQAGDTRIRAPLLNNVALTYLSLGQTETAIGFAAESLETYRLYPDRSADAFPLDTMAQAYDQQGNHERAIALYSEALQIALKYDRLSGAAGILIRMGESHLAAGDSVSAANAWRHGIDLIDRTARSRDQQERAELVELLATL
jgi:DNA-binding SARP family transcriptional activator/tetratricopeptide (TPR) repeat protein